MAKKIIEELKIALDEISSSGRKTIPIINLQQYLDTKQNETKRNEGMAVKTLAYDVVFN